MPISDVKGVGSQVQTVYDEPQHCIAVKQPQEKTVAMDCPYTGKGEEFSPTNLLEAALAGCMLLSMGMVAMRNKIDITGTRVDVKISTRLEPVMRYEAIDVTFTMPRNFSDPDRIRLKTAAAACPIKHSFDPSIPINVQYNYPE